MKILHYFLGFPPYRTGGLTKYAFDLMKAQSADENTVIGLWPGEMKIFHCGVRIKKRKNQEGIGNYEIINPLPVPLDEGINETDVYMMPCDISVYEDFLKSVCPDVIHIHTLMGLHREFIEAAKKLNIRTVFTTHDYFGICPRVTLYRYGKTCNEDHGCEDCIQCNCNPLSMRKIQIMQSPLYREMKDSAIVKALRKKHRGNFFKDENLPDMPDINVAKMAENYRKLRSYYVSMLEKIDFIHFNSNLAEKVYRKYFVPKAYRVMPITHQNISDNRTIINWKPEARLRITFLSPAKPFKGFNILKTALDELWNSGKRDFELAVFSPVVDPSPYMRVTEDGFEQNQLKSILSDTDIVIVPSVWYETFGFTALEAVSYGVPVIVSDNVGAKDVIGDGGIVIEAGNVEALKKAILSLNRETQQKLRYNIQNHMEIKTWRAFLDENYAIY